MEELKKLAGNLLSSWCEGLYRHQIRGTGDARVDGAFICPACGKTHGRSADAIYPFMTMYSLSHDEKWLQASESLLDWSEHVVSCADGSYINDIDSKWRGITVFALISYMDALSHHGNIMPESFRTRLEERAYKAASYLAFHDEYKRNNINYPISIALALYMAGVYFNNDAFISKSCEYKEIIPSVITGSNLIYGEGVPRDMISGRGCRSVDIGYNTEESIPSMVRLAVISNDDILMDLSLKVFQAHMRFMLPDGGWDNSIGTRVFKWTYWGSRTSDGAAAALLMLPDQGQEFVRAAYHNLCLMEKCTYEDLLYGGPDLYIVGESPCIHHTFTHAKIPALILDEHLFPEFDDNAEKPVEYIGYLPEIDTYKVETRGFIATVTGYDWPYMKGGHASGGTMTLLHGRDLGPILVSGMAEYSIKEANNQQIPSAAQLHECLAPRIETKDGDSIISSVYDVKSEISRDDRAIHVQGYLSNVDNSRSSIPYCFDYSFADDAISLKAKIDAGCFIIPVVSRQDEAISISGNIISFGRGFAVAVENGSFGLPYGERRIFNLVPGLQALKLEISPDASGLASVRIIRRNHE